MPAENVTSDPQDIVFRLDDVIVHSFSSQFVIALLDRLHDFLVLTSGHVAKVVNLDCRVHDPFHLGARFTHRANEHLVAR